MGREIPGWRRGAAAGTQTDHLGTLGMSVPPRGLGSCPRRVGTEIDTVPTST